MMGRPTKLTQEMGDLICSLISEGKSLRKICALEGMPRISTIMEWVVKGSRGEEKYKDFAEQYVRALELRAEYWAEEIVDISDDDSEDAIFTEDGKRLLNSEFVQRSRLKVDTRKWIMSKLKPKKYGDKQTHEHTGKDGKPIDNTLNIYLHDKPGQ